MTRQGKERTRRKKQLDPFSELTWDDVEEWAGDRIVTRGRSYQRRGAVRDIKRAEDGALIAWVQGTRRYATRVSIRGKKNLESECTCPYWTTCKHAVAVVLEYLESIKSRIAVARVEEDDPRQLQLEAMTEELEELEEFENLSEDFDMEEYEEDLEEVKEKVEARPGSTKSQTSKPSSLRAYLQEQTKGELVSLVAELADAHDEVRQLLADRRTLATGQTHKILRTIRREITALEEPEWDRHDYGVPVANTDRLEAALKALVAAGQADAAVRLGPELLASGNRVLEYEHEGESSDAISACVNVLFRALDATSLSPADQMEWALDMALADAYDLCDAGLENLWERGYAKSDWSAVSDRLEQRLEAIESAGDEDEGDEDDFPHHFERRLIADWLIHALERAGRQKEIIPLCEREAPITLSYDRLVDRLMAGRRWEEARCWCQQGIRAAPSTYPGYGAQLRQQLRTIFQRSGNPLAGLAIQAEEFFARPSLPGFQALCEAARKSCLGKGVEAWGRHYLQTGRRPGVCRKRRSDPEMDWPLPASEVEVTAHPQENEAPMTELLIQLAIAEKKPDEVLKWYDHASREEGGLYDFSLDIQVAEAVKSAHPDRAITIWKDMAEKQIARVQASGYQAAVPYLRKIKNALIRTRRKQEWEAYLTSLRQQNSRRPRCLGELDRLEGGGRRIIDS